MSLTGVAPDGRGGLWVVGHGGLGTEIGPVIYRRDDARWTRQRAPRVKGEGVLTDVVASSADDGWAVGYQRVDGRSLPLVLHWDGQRWARAVAPDFDSDEVVLTAVTSAPAGGIWVVGAAWDAAAGDHEAVAAWWDGHAWDEVAGFARASELQDAAGSLDATAGPSGGRASSRWQRASACPHRTAASARAALPADPAAERLAQHDTGAKPEEAAAGTAGAVAATTRPLAARTPAAHRPGERDKGSRSSRRAERHRHRLWALPAPRADEHLAARDVAIRAGIAEQTSSYGAVVADFDADGVDDLFIGRHGRPGRLLLNRDGVFVDHAPMRFPPIDRHGCSAADVDGSGLPDLYCTIGGKRGSGLKSNELWLDPGGAAPRQVAVEHGVSDPTGRGRRATFLEASHGRDVDLVVTNSPTRVDGLPSIGRLFRSRGDATFDGPRAHRVRGPPRLALARRMPTTTATAARTSLLVTGGPQAPLPGGHATLPQHGTRSRRRHAAIGHPLVRGDRR